MTTVMQIEVPEAKLTITPAQVTVTDYAAEKIRSLIAEQGEPVPHLRVYIEGGGCSGFQYSFMYDNAIDENDDYVYSKEFADGASPTTIHLLIDSISYQYLQGAEVDYKQDLQGERFVIKNPNAKTTCGCGSSFAVADVDEKES
jgi:iron-sulfur cluster insertion protein